MTYEPQMSFSEIGERMGLGTDQSHSSTALGGPTPVTVAAPARWVPIQVGDITKNLCDQNIDDPLLDEFMREFSPPFNVAWYPDKGCVRGGQFSFTGVNSQNRLADLNMYEAIWRAWYMALVAASRKNADAAPACEGKEELTDILRILDAAPNLPLDSCTPEELQEWTTAIKSVLVHIGANLPARAMNE